MYVGIGVGVGVGTGVGLGVGVGIGVGFDELHGLVLGGQDKISILQTYFTPL